MGSVAPDRRAIVPTRAKNVARYGEERMTKRCEGEIVSSWSPNGFALQPRRAAREE
jgi:hypothetical protein